MKKAYRFFVLLVFLLLFASCSAKNVEKELASGMATSYFTIDYQDLGNWLGSYQTSSYYANFLAKEAMPVLSPYFVDNMVQSSAKLQSIDEYYHKDFEDKEDVTVWKIVLDVNPPWPGDGPPYPFNTGAAQNIPWPENGKATVYVATNNDDQKEIFLISPLDIDQIVENLSK